MTSIPPVPSSGISPLNSSGASVLKEATQPQSPSKALEVGSASRTVEDAVDRGDLGNSLKERFDKWTSLVALNFFQFVSGLKALAGNTALERLKQSTANESPNLAELQCLNQLREMRLAQAQLRTDSRSKAYLKLSQNAQHSERAIFETMRTLGEDPTQAQINIAHRTVVKGAGISHILTQAGDLPWITDPVAKEEVRGQTLEAVALFLQQCPQATHQDVEELVTTLHKAFQACSEPFYTMRQGVLRFAADKATRIRQSHTSGR